MIAYLTVAPRRPTQIIAFFGPVGGGAKHRKSDSCRIGGEKLNAEYACRSRLKWKRDGADWVLHCGRRRMGRVVPDDKYPGMFRSVKSRGLSDTANHVLEQGCRDC